MSDHKVLGFENPTNEELLTALRVCGDDSKGCRVCPLFKSKPCSNLFGVVADRIAQQAKQIESLQRERQEPMDEEKHMIVFINDPLKVICEIAKEIKPDIEVDVQYHEGLEGAGCTTFPDDGERILIDINPSIPFGAVAEILAHELSHAIVGKTDGDGHTPEWESTFQEIFDRYEARISKGAEKG